LTNRPLVSVIIPYYNDTETIERALVSVANQSFVDFEIIIVDDYSSQVPGSFHVPGCSAPLRVIRHEENKGVAAARNTGILSSAGRWVAFLDADDAWHTDKLARQIAALEAATEYGSVTGFALYRDHARPPEIHIPNDPAPLLNQLAMGCTLSPGSTLIVLREVFNDIGLYDDSLRRLEDWDWLIRFAKHYQLVALPECFADIHVSRKKQSQNLTPILGAQSFASVFCPS
jgi:glycosyltransferase involved in cell wall biosynthesis